jgi:hypothetical protein
MTLPSVRAPGGPPPSPLSPKVGAETPTGRRFIEVLEEGRHSAADGARRRAAVPSPSLAAAVASAAPAAGPTRSLLESGLRSENKIDAILIAAGRGKTFSAAELLAMQATVFRYSQTVEVVSRAADRLVGAIKQTLGTQV